MDLIPIPLTSLPGILVPFLDIIPYDFEGFSSFPLRHGFLEAELTDTNVSPTRIACLLQSWLYFGLISEVSQRTVNSGDFVHRVEGSTVPLQIQSNALEILIQRKEIYTETRPEEVERRRSLVKEAVLWLRVVEDSPLHTYNNSPIMEVTLSIRMLFYALGPYVGWPDLELEPHSLISKHLQDHGWCPSHIRRIETLKNDVIAYYLSCLYRPNPRGILHKSCPTTHCESNSTTLSNNYKISHLHKDAVSCRLVSVDEIEVRKIIAAGGIPLISIEITISDEIKLRVYAANSRNQYVAISHVWSDGMGNPHSNALPECQLRRLAKRLALIPNSSSRIYDDNSRTQYSFGPFTANPSKLRFNYLPADPSMSFWMDTLCIPVASDKNDDQTKELKRRAINQMATIYSSASHVLVLDSLLVELRIGAMQQSEVLAHILFGNWMGRSWTLQEGALNPHVYFQFADGALNILDIMSDSSNTPDSITVHPARLRRVGLLESLLSVKWAWDHTKPASEYQDRDTVHIRFEQLIYQTLYKCSTEALHNYGHTAAANYLLAPQRDISYGDAQWVQRLVTVWNALVLRTTTMAEDLPAILANLLSVNAYDVLGLPSEVRIRAILAAKNILPLSLLYNRGPRLRPAQNHRGRWIPTLMGRFPLDEVPIMRLDDSNHNLILRSLDIAEDYKPTLLLSTNRLIISDNQFMLPYDAYDSTRGWKITCHREKEDEFIQDPNGYTAFIIEGNSKSTWRKSHPLPRKACCIRIIQGEEDNRHNFSAVYDCPCTALRVMSTNSPQVTSNIKKSEEEDFDDVGLNVYEVENLESSEWNITIVGDPGEPIQKISQNPVPRSRIPKWLGNFFYI